MRENVYSRGEVRFVLVAGLIVLAVTSIPYVFGAAQATEERVFGGFVYSVGDCYSYLSKMRQGAEGAWLFHVPYTPEPHPGALFYPFYLLLGKLAALVPGGDLTARLVWTYHGARWVLGLALLLTTYRFLATLTSRVAVRRLAWLMVATGSGLGWLLVALGRPDWLGETPLDFILPEGFTFLVLYALPHIALAKTLLLWGVLFLLRAWGIEAVSIEGTPGALRLRPDGAHRKRAFLRWGSAQGTSPQNGAWRCALLAGLAWLLMGLVVPFYVAVAWAVTGAAWLVLGLRRRRVAWRELSAAGVAALVSAPVVAYSAWMFTREPVYAAWAAQNLILSPHPLHYLAAYGIPLALGCLAVRSAWRSERPAWLALAWVGVASLLVYAPFNAQRRLVEGAQVSLGLLAAMGVMRFRSKGFRFRLVAGALLVVLSLTNVMLVAGNCLALRGLPPTVYREGGEVTAMDWLAGQAGPEDVVLASFETGNYLPARVGARVFVGHGPETVRFDEKKELVARFFAVATNDGWRRALLDEYGVDYVFWGPAERELGGYDPGTADFLRQVLEVGEYEVFEVGG